MSNASKINTEVSHVARIWNYWLGGHDNYPVDREMGDQISTAMPQVVELARESRHFLGRAVDLMAGELGIAQFLDIGTGLPTVDNTHEIAQGLNPAARVVYVDNDPLVLAHARALLNSTEEGACAYIDADLRAPERILETASATLDFSRPVGLLLMGIMEFVPDHEEAYAITDRLIAELPSGSCLALYGTTNIVHGEATDRAAEMWNSSGAAQMVVRTVDQVGRFFQGLELVDPGLVQMGRWRPLHPDLAGPDVDGVAAVGRKP